MGNEKRGVGEVNLKTSTVNGDVKIEIETDRGGVEFSITAQGAVNFGLQLISSPRHGKEMADKPALFPAPMVRALLREIATPGTGKTQTRRVIEPYAPAPFPGSKPSAPVGNIIVAKIASRLGGFMQGPSFLPKYAVGDRIWVRENWRVSSAHDGMKPRDMHSKFIVEYAADDNNLAIGKLRPSMFMPKWASRITLEVTGVKVERLQECSARDAAAEGVELEQWKTGIYPFFDPGVDADNRKLVNLYRNLWDQINGPGAWDKNPWVAAYTFRPILKNIDA